MKKNDFKDIVLLKRFIKYLKCEYKLLIVMYICAFFNATSTIALPILIQRGIDNDIANKDLQGLYTTSAILLVILVIQLASARIQGVLLMKIGNRVFYRLRKEVFEHLQSLSFEFFDKHKTGQVMTRVTNDVQVLEELLTSGLDTLFVDLLKIIGIILAMIILDFRLSVILVIILPILVVIVFGIRTKITKVADEIQKGLSSINDHLNESLSGIMVSRAFAREEKNVEDFYERNDIYYNKAKKFYPLIGFFWQSVTALNNGSMGLVIIGGGILLKYDLITIGVIVAYLSYVTQLFQPMQKISNMLNQLSRALISTRRIFEILDEKIAVGNIKKAIKDFNIKGNIEFKDVKFSYNKSELILNDINFKVKNGQTVAIVGATGSGKTTIVNLISRFYDIDSGNILIDDIDIREMDLSEYRSQTSVVMQEPQIFSGTILDNIRFSKPDATDEEVYNVAKNLNIHNMILKFPRGYKTNLSEHGDNISIGQKQLLSFARAMIKNPKILILDEASSYLDTRTEKIIQKTLEKMMENRTTFVIAHRLSTIQNADVIMVIKSGKLVEKGNHRELMRLNKNYAVLVRSQTMSVS
jgi:ABC-type multidrug transport system fused ATPase/permease subunit